MHRSRSHNDVIETAKTKLHPVYEAKKRQQSERHVLSKEMAEDAIAHLPVSRRTDKSSNGFNCAICHKMCPSRVVGSLKLGAISEVNNTSSETAVFALTTKSTCIPFVRKRYKWRLFQLKYWLKSKKFRQWS